MTDILLIIASFLSALATIAIAFFTKKTIQLTRATLELNKSIQENSAVHQTDMKKLEIGLVAASLYAATNPPGKSLQTGKLKEFRRIVEEEIE